MVLKGLNQICDAYLDDVNYFQCALVGTFVVFETSIAKWNRPVLTLKLNKYVFNNAEGIDLLGHHWVV